VMAKDKKMKPPTKVEFPNFPQHTPQTQMQVVKNAIYTIEKNKLAEKKDYSIFNDLKGWFVQGVNGDYRFLHIVNCKTGKGLAQPMLPVVVGIPVLGVKDTKGRAYVLEWCQTDKKYPRGGWSLAHQHWSAETGKNMNPTKKAFPLYFYTESPKNHPHIAVVSGSYDAFKYSIKELNMIAVKYRQEIEAHRKTVE